MNPKTILPALAAGIFTATTLFSNEPAPANSLFHPPFQVQVGGSVLDTGPNNGHSSPCVVDLDQDGLKDLVVGDFGGKFQYYRNIGKTGAPVYGPGTKLQAGGVDAEVKIYCCIGAQPRFCDLNGDGLLDMISNSYDPGFCYLFRGLPGGKFAAREELLDRAGKPISSKPAQVVYGSFYETVDWENDGDLDLLIGCFEGDLKVRINEGTPQKMEFAAENKRVEANGQPLHVESHFCPVVADWDGDGLWDILAGSNDGSVTWFRNTGSKTSPDFAKGELLVEKTDGAQEVREVWSDADWKPSARSQVEVTDYDGDKKTDLLVGDFGLSLEFKKDLTDAQREEAKSILAEGEVIGARFKKKMKEISDDLKKRYPANDQSSTDAMNEEWNRAYQALQQGPEAKEMEEEEETFVNKLRPFLARTRSTGDHIFDLAVPHGFVWVYLRK